MTFDQYLAAFVLGRVRTSDLPDVAAQALVEGHDSLHIAALAGTKLGECSRSELEALFERGLTELDKTLPGRIEAGLALRQYFAEQVAGGLLAPRLGAAEIVRLATELNDDLPSREYAGDGFGVAALVGLYYSHEEVPAGDDRAHRRIDSELLSEMQRLARRGEV